MPTRTENMLAKAQRLVDTHRCHELASSKDGFWFGVVDGDHGRHLTAFVHAGALPRLGTGSIPPATSCSCDAGQRRQTCSHVLAAQALVPVDVDDLFTRLGA